MQGLKWRLSFQSSRSNRQLKKLWVDTNVRSDFNFNSIASAASPLYIFSFIPQIRGCDEDLDVTKLKALVLFLDAVLSAQDQQAQRSAVDELCDIIVDLFNSLMSSLKICQRKSKNTMHSASDESSLLNEVMAKVLLVSELFCTTKGTKQSFKDLIAVHNPCIRLDNAF